MYPEGLRKTTKTSIKIKDAHTYSQHGCLISVFRGKQANLLLFGNFRKKKKKKRRGTWESGRIVRDATFTGRTFSDLKVPRNSPFGLLLKCGSMRR
jgi:hypothetical protein